jgi:hypothetical protein
MNKRVLDLIRRYVTVTAAAIGAGDFWGAWESGSGWE